MLKDFLIQKGILFEEKLVDQEESARDEMIAKSGGYLGVPFTLIDKDGKEESIIGFDKSKLEAVLGIK